MPNSVNKQTPPAIYVTSNHLPSALKIPRSPRIYFGNDGAFCTFVFSLMKIQDKRTETRQIAGNAKNTEYQMNKPNSAPMIGDNTLPKPFEASTIPKTRLCSLPFFYLGFSSKRKQ